MASIDRFDVGIGAEWHIHYGHMKYGSLKETWINYDKIDSLDKLKGILITKLEKKQNLQYKPYYLECINFILKKQGLDELNQIPTLTFQQNFEKIKVELNKVISIADKKSIAVFPENKAIDEAFIKAIVETYNSCKKHEKIDQDQLDILHGGLRKYYNNLKEKINNLLLTASDMQDLNQMVSVLKNANNEKAFDSIKGTSENKEAYESLEKIKEKCKLINKIGDSMMKEFLNIFNHLNIINIDVNKFIERFNKINSVLPKLLALVKHNDTTFNKLGEITLDNILAYDNPKDFMQAYLKGDLKK